MDAVATAVAAGLVAFGLQVGLAVLDGALLGSSAWSWSMLFDLLQWVAYPLLAVLLVSPAGPERLPFRYRTLVRGAKEQTMARINSGRRGSRSIGSAGLPGRRAAGPCEPGRLGRGDR